MNSFAFFSVIAGVLQLTVPSYALRLVRRFGAQSVGWFIVAAFAALGLLHLLQPARTLHLGLSSGLVANAVFAFTSGLLLLGMTHLETLLSERVRLQREEQQLHASFEAKVAQKMTELRETNCELVEEIALREQREKALRESETQYRSLFADNPQPMWIFDLRSLRFLAVNHAALSHYGMDYEEFMALSAQELAPASAAAAFLQDIAKPCMRVESRGLWQHCRKDLSLIDVELSAVDLKFAGCPARLVLAQDVTQRRRDELQSVRKQNAEVVSRLAGGFAHHFNNILTIIDGQANLLLRNPQDAKAAEQLGQITSAANRAAALTRQLLAAAGCQSLRPEAVDLRGVIENQSQTLKRLVGDRIVIQKILGANPPMVLAENRVIEHTLIQLILNARDAMPAGGTIQIETSFVGLDAVQAKRHPDAKPGEFVRLGVRDTGCGIAPEVQGRLFEPFFTTHDIGKGTGLGLASISGSIRQLGGWVEFKTEVGTGTEFQVFFPCVPGSASPGQKDSRTAVLAKRGTVLLLEPDDRARGVARYILNRQGYQVIETDSANTAELLWEGQGTKVDLAIMEVNLPGITGPELVERLRQTRPDLHVVYLATPAPDGQASAMVSVKDLVFVSKPYTPDTLLEALQAAWPKTSERKTVTKEQPSA
jgi:two-component system cell cycle sensor histidine kinase/response regulator CckA